MLSSTLNIRDISLSSLPSTGLVVSIALHSLLVALLIVGWVPEEKHLKVATPKFIDAKLLQMKPAISAPKPKKEEPKPAPKPQPKPQPKEDKAAIKKAEEQKQQDIKKQQQVQAERKRQEQLKKEEVDRKRQEQLKKEQADRQRQEELRRQEQTRRQQELAQALALEEDEMEASEDDVQVGTYVDYMAGLVASNWSRPPSARRGMEVLLEISLGSAGRVTSVKVVKSSGNSAFDMSAEQAVKKVGQFSRLNEMEPGLYQREFRRINLIFRPDDLRM